MAPRKTPKKEKPLAAANAAAPAHSITDYQEIQNNEIEAISSIYADGYEVIDVAGPWGAISSQKAFRLKLQAPADPEVWICISVKFPATYPKTVPMLDLERSNELRVKSLNAINHVLKSMPKSLLGHEMIFEISDAIIQILDEAAELKAKGDALPALDEERVQSEAMASKLAHDEHLKKIESKEREQAEEDRNLQVLVSQEKYRREEDTRRKLRTTSTDHLPISELADPEPIIFDRVITVAKEKFRYSFKSVGGLTKLHHGPVTDVYTVYPRTIGVESKDIAAPLHLVLKQCVVRRTSALEKVKIHSLQKELEALRKLDPHPNLLGVLDFRVDSTLDGWELKILLQFADMSLATYLTMPGDLLIETVRNWTGDLLEALNFFHNKGLSHGSIRPSNILLFQGAGTWTVKLSDSLFQSSLYDIKHKPGVSSAWAVNWKAPEVSTDQRQKLAQKTDVWDIGIVFVQMIFGLDIPEKSKGPADLLALNISAPLKTIIGDFFRREAKKRPTAFELIPSDFLRNQHSVYDHVSDENHSLSRTPHSNSIKLRRLSSAGIVSAKQTSRYKVDWDEISRLGKGGYGEVVKARNKIDHVIYAIKKIRQPENLLSRVLPEIMLLSRLNHPNVVRYYGAWMESEADELVLDSSEASQLESTLETTTEQEQNESLDIGRLPPISHGLDFISSGGPTGFTFGTESDDEDDTTEQAIDEESDAESSGDDLSEDEDSNVSATDSPHGLQHKPSRASFNQPPKYAILYIQMEFCERQTLRDLIIKRLDKNMDEVWRLLRKIVSGLAHIHDAGIIHRDLKPENIFIDTTNSPKIGDFGLATSGVHAAVLRVSHSGQDNDMTKDIGTASYVAPEVQSNSKGNYTEKVDMYSLGVILVEMCFPCSTGMERALVIGNIRKRDCILPPALNTPETTKQRDIILSLLSHRPHDRPSAKDLLRSGKIPFQVEDDLTQEMLKGLDDPSSEYYAAAMNVLFINNRMSEVKAAVWDETAASSSSRMKTDATELLILSRIKKKLTSIFESHSAVESDRPIIFPRSTIYDNKNIVNLLGSHGTLLQLPYDLTLPLAQVVAREAPTVEKMFTFGRVYRDDNPGGPPRAVSEVDFDIVSNNALDIALKEAEVLAVLDQVMEELKFLSTQSYFYVNHWDTLESILDFCRIDLEHRPQAKVILSGLKHGSNDWTSIKGELRQVGIPNISLDDLAKFDIRDTPEKAYKQLKKLMPDSRSHEALSTIHKGLQAVMNYTKAFGLKRKIYWCPLSCFHAEFYESGIMFQLLVDVKQTNAVIAAGGRYDRLIQLQKPKGSQGLFNNCHAVGLSLAIESLVRLIMQQQMKSKSGSLKRFGQEKTPKYWPVRRGDILVASFDSRILRSAGLHVLSHLWNHGFRAELAEDASSIEDIVQHYEGEKHSWIVVVKDESVYSKTQIKIVTLPSKHDVDVPFDNLIQCLDTELRTRDEAEAKFLQSTTKQEKISRFTHRLGSLTGPVAANQNLSSSSSDKPLNVQFLVGQHKGKKTNRTVLIEAAQSHISTLFSSLRESAPVVAVETSDDLLEPVRNARLSDPESWRKAVQSAAAGDRSYFQQLQKMLEGYRAEWMEDSEKSRMAFIFNFRTGWVCLYDLAQ